MRASDVIYAEINAIIDGKIAAGEPVAQQWVVDVLLARHGVADDFSKLAVAAAVERCFASLADERHAKAEDHEAHAAALRARVAAGRDAASDRKRARELMAKGHPVDLPPGTRFRRKTKPKPPV